MARPKMNFRNIDVIQSNRIASTLTGAGDTAHRRKGSGSKWYAKGDAISSMFLVEAKDKATPSETRTISKKTFNKLKEEAIYENRIPLYVVGFGDGKDFYIMEERDFADIIERMVRSESIIEEVTKDIQSYDAGEDEATDTLENIKQKLRGEF